MKFLGLTLQRACRRHKIAERQTSHSGLDSFPPIRPFDKTCFFADKVLAVPTPYFISYRSDNSPSTHLDSRRSWLLIDHILSLKFAASRSWAHTFHNRRTMVSQRKSSSKAPPGIEACPHRLFPPHFHRGPTRNDHHEHARTGSTEGYPGGR